MQLLIIIIMIIKMGVFLEGLSVRNMLNCAEQEQIQKYKTHAYKTLKTAGVQTIMLKHSTKQFQKKLPPQKKTNKKKQKQKNPKTPNKTKQNKYRINVQVIRRWDVK